jgi:hypothetical protein
MVDTAYKVGGRRELARDISREERRVRVHFIQYEIKYKQIKFHITYNKPA